MSYTRYGLPCSFDTTDSASNCVQYGERVVCAWRTRSGRLIQMCPFAVLAPLATRRKAQEAWSNSSLHDFRPVCSVRKQNAIPAVYSGTRALRTVRTGLGERRAPTCQTISYNGHACRFRGARCLILLRGKGKSWGRNGSPGAILIWLGVLRGRRPKPLVIAATGCRAVRAVDNRDPRVSLKGPRP